METICETDNIRLNLDSLKPLYKGKTMPSTTIARGNAISTFYIAPTLTPTSVTTLTTGAQTFNIAGLLTTDIINCMGVVGNQTAGIIIVEADCTTAGVLTIQFGNFTAGTLTPAAGVYYIEIIRPEGPLPVTAV